MSDSKSIRYVHATKPSGIQVIDALLEGYVWNQDYDGGLSLSFSFPWTQGSSWFNGRTNNYTKLDEPSATYHYALSAVEQQAARSALQAWANVANIRFNEVPDNATSAGDIRIAWTSATNDGGKSWGWAYAPAEIPAAGDIWLYNNNSATKNPVWNKSSFNYMSLMHEIGHTLGLKHPFDDDINLPKDLDNTRMTIMSYDIYDNHTFRTISYDSSGKPSFNYFNILPETPMILDIAAAQYLYGPNMSYHAGDDVYNFDPNTPFMMTIWDAGGNDTISARDFKEACYIDLNDGHYSNLTIKSAPNPPGYIGGDIPDYTGYSNLGIAWGAHIENAVGGSGDDVLIGNKLNNLLAGMNGNDQIIGGDGIDTAMYLGPRSNYLIGTLGNKLIVTAKTGLEGRDQLETVERLLFSDLAVAFDTNGAAGQAYRLYQAAFDRKPDLAGLGYWIYQLDRGTDINAVADAFLGSPEFVKLVGSNPSNAALVSSFYKNVLHRAPDNSGYQFWLSNLDKKLVTPAMVLAAFAESPENQAQVVGSIQNGIDYQVWA